LLDNPAVPVIVLNTLAISPQPPRRTAEEWIAKWKEWVDSHKEREYRPFVDDARESIQEGWGE
jgi:hypothetical protein